MRLTLCLLALGSWSAALPAQAQKDVASCKIASDAELKTITTPHHAHSTNMHISVTYDYANVKAPPGV